MSTSDRFSTSLQENLLVLLCFDDRASTIIRNSVEPHLWGNVIYREVVARVYDYLDRFKKAPGDHTPDLLEDQIAKGTPEAALFVDLLSAIHEHKDKINAEYTLTQLERFVRVQSLKSTVIRAGEALQEDELDQVETILQDGLRTRLSVFKPGMRLTEGLKLAYTKQVRQNVLQLGIKQLDDWELGCGDGELHLYIAGPKTGKSWWLTHNTKRCLLHHQPTLYLTLELSEAQIAQRIMQSLFSMTRRKAKIPVTRIRVDDLGRLVRFEPDMLGGRLSFDDPTTEVLVERRLGAVHGGENLIIKQFPAGQLTVNGLRAYLDLLERAENFVPRKIILDYVKYMKHDTSNYRLERAALLDNLRGLAVERNIGIITAGESNREGAKSKQVTGLNLGEDYSGTYTADTIFAYTQTGPERALGLARLFVDSTRVADRDKFVVLISQAYPVGQYCLDSVMMNDNYWGHLETATANLPQQQVEVAEE